MLSIIQHLPWEGPGLIADLLRERGIPYRIHRTDLGEPLPTADACDRLIVMGGTMGVYEADRFPHLSAEIALLSTMLAASKPVLGICLGSQLLAAALGAEVYKGPAMESGPGTVTLTPAGLADPVMGPAGPELPVIHWHQDSFPLPAGATLLASSNLYEQQAFRYGPNAYGWQFHPEVTPSLAADWRTHGLELPLEKVREVETSGRTLLARFFIKFGI